MDLNFITDLCIPIIIVAALVVGYLWKNFFPADNKWIPLILAALGAVLAVIMQGVSVESIVAGAISGLTATGLHQTFKQLINSESEGDDGDN